MKIALTTHTAYPDFIGGREKHVHNLASALSETDDVVVIAGGKGKEIQRRSLKGYTLLTLPTISLKVSSNPLQIYRIIPKFFSVLKKENPDLIHAFEYGSYSTDIVYLYSKRTGIPFLLTVYGYQFRNPVLKFLKMFYDYFVGRRIIKRASQIFCPSNVQQEEILKIMRNKNIENKTTIQENCIRVRDYQNLELNDCFKRMHGLGDEVKILTVIRILPRKGITYLIYAFKKVIDQGKHSNIKLFIVGPDCGELKNIRIQIKLLKLEDKVVIIGPVAPAHIKDFLNICDIFVLPSLYEGLPLVLLEAMAAGKAVVFTNLSCAKELVKDGENGLLTKLADVDSLASAISKLICNKQLREYLGNNAFFSVKKFDSQFEAEKTRKVYELVIS